MVVGSKFRLRILNAASSSLIIEVLSSRANRVLGPYIMLAERLPPANVYQTDIGKSIMLYVYRTSTSIDDIHPSSTLNMGAKAVHSRLTATSQIALLPISHNLGGCLWLRAYRKIPQTINQSSSIMKMFLFQNRKPYQSLSFATWFGG